jgi:hypothetical protein
MMQISLRSCDLVLLELAVLDPSAREERLGARIADGWEDFADAMRVSLDKLRANSTLNSWWTHLVDTPLTVGGVCSYAGPPTADGVVEIAYGIASYATTTSLNSSLNPSQFGQPVTFTARVTSSGPTPTGRVTFLDGTAAIGSATLSGDVATLTKSSPAIGTHLITAEYVGDADNAESTSSALDQVVQ